MVETPQLRQAKAEIARLNRDLEQRVLDRPTQLGRRWRTRGCLVSSAGKQKALAHVTRLSTVSELTASLAHSGKQPLAAIVANARASLRWLDMTAGDGRGHRSDAARDPGRERAAHVIAQTRDS